MNREVAEQDALPVSLLVAIGVLFAGFVVSMVVANVAGFACSSGDELPWSLEADLCDGYAGSYSVIRWLALLWPSIAFGIGQFIPYFRRRPLLMAVPLALLGVAFWLVTAVIVID